MRVGEGTAEDFLAGVCARDASRPRVVEVNVGIVRQKLRADGRYNFKKDDVVFFRRRTHLAYPARHRRK